MKNCVNVTRRNIGNANNLRSHFRNNYLRNDTQRVVVSRKDFINKPPIRPLQTREGASPLSFFIEACNGNV